MRTLERAASDDYPQVEIDEACCLVMLRRDMVSMGHGCFRASPRLDGGHALSYDHPWPWVASNHRTPRH